MSGARPSGPQLARRVSREGVAYWIDVVRAKAGVIVAFSERSGGVSTGAYGGLNLAAHVGDAPEAVDRNRSLFLEALGIEHARDRLVCAQQVHGASVARVDRADSGRGAYAAHGRPPLSDIDALVTCHSDIPLMLFFADCVPVVLVAPGPCVAVVHAGWRGALDGVVAATARRLAEVAGCEPSSLDAYIGAHIRACHYQVDEMTMSHFVNHFGTVARAESGGLDLGLVVAASLQTAGVDPCSTASLGICTAETTDRFYSYRAEAGPTGRHGALAYVEPHSS